MFLITVHKYFFNFKGTKVFREAKLLLRLMNPPLKETYGYSAKLTSLSLSL